MAGVNLFDMLAQAQGGQGLGNLGRQFGLTDEQTQMAAKALLPALSSGLKRNAAQPGGLEALMGALATGRHQTYYDQPEALGRPETVADGNAILGHILGSKDVSREAAARASQQTGVSDSVLKQMLPVLATMAMGALSKQAAQPQTRNAMQQAVGQFNAPQAGGGGLLGAVLGAVMSGGAKPQAAQQQQGGALGLLGGLLDADGDGSAMDDIFDMVMKSQRR